MVTCVLVHSIPTRANKLTQEGITDSLAMEKKKKDEKQTYQNNPSKYRNEFLIRTSDSNRFHNSDPGINYKGLHCIQIVGGKKALH